MLSTLSHGSFANVAFESFSVSLTDNGPLLSFQGRSYLTDNGPLLSFQGRSYMVPFPRLSPQGEWCSYVLGFVPAGNVSSSSTLQIFQDTSHLWWLLCLAVYLLSHFSSLWHVHRSFQGGSRPLAHSSLGFPINVKMWLTSDQLWFLILCWYIVVKTIQKLWTFSSFFFSFSLSPSPVDR